MSVNIQKWLSENPRIVIATQAFVDTVMREAERFAVEAGLAALPGPIAALVGPVITALGDKAEAFAQGKVDAEFAKFEPPAVNPDQPAVKIIKPESGAAGVTEVLEVDTVKAAPAALPMNPSASDVLGQKQQARIAQGNAPAAQPAR